MLSLFIKFYLSFVFFSLWPAVTFVLNRIFLFNLLRLFHPNLFHYVLRLCLDQIRFLLENRQAVIEPGEGFQVNLLALLPQLFYEFPFPDMLLEQVVDDPIQHVHLLRAEWDHLFRITIHHSLLSTHYSLLL